MGTLKKCGNGLCKQSGAPRLLAVGRRAVAADTGRSSKGGLDEPSSRLRGLLGVTKDAAIELRAECLEVLTSHRWFVHHGVKAIKPTATLSVMRLFHLKVSGPRTTSATTSH